MTRINQIVALVLTAHVACGHFIFPDEIGNPTGRRAAPRPPSFKFPEDVYVNDDYLGDAFLSRSLSLSTGTNTPPSTAPSEEEGEKGDDSSLFFVTNFPPDNMSNHSLTPLPSRYSENIVTPFTRPHTLDPFFNHAFDYYEENDIEPTAPHDPHYTTTVTHYAIQEVPVTETVVDTQVSVHTRYITLFHTQTSVLEVPVPTTHYVTHPVPVYTTQYITQYEPQEVPVYTTVYSTFLHTIFETIYNTVHIPVTQTEYITKHVTTTEKLYVTVTEYVTTISISYTTVARTEAVPYPITTTAVYPLFMTETIPVLQYITSTVVSYVHITTTVALPKYVTINDYAVVSDPVYVTKRPHNSARLPYSNPHLHNLPYAEIPDFAVDLATIYRDHRDTVKTGFYPVRQNALNSVPSNIHNNNFYRKNTFSASVPSRFSVPGSSLISANASNTSYSRPTVNKGIQYRTHTQVQNFLDGADNKVSPMLLISSQNVLEESEKSPASHNVTSLSPSKIVPSRITVTKTLTTTSKVTKHVYSTVVSKNP